MFEADHIWNVGFVACPDPCIYWYSEYGVAGEVTFNGVVYRQLTIDGVNAALYMREENDEIYQYFQNTDEEFLIMDFTLEVGDIFTLPPPYQTDLVEDMYLYEITTEEIAGEMRKVLYFDYCQGCGTVLEIWVEGIGSSVGLFPGGHLIDSGSGLTCFTERGITYLLFGATACFQVASIDDFGKNDAILYPNPVVRTSTLQFSAEGIADKVIIVDINGKQVRSIPVNSAYALINAMDYRSGLYFYQVYSEEKLLQTEKFIVE